MVTRRKYSRGDRVVFIASKFSAHPGPRARDVYPTPNGDLYTYRVDKYWVVEDLQDDGTLRLKTRRGKCHTLSVDDIRLRPATLWERWFYADRFPEISEQGDVSESSQAVANS